MPHRARGRTGYCEKPPAPIIAIGTRSGQEARGRQRMTLSRLGSLIIATEAAHSAKRQAQADRWFFPAPFVDGKRRAPAKRIGMPIA
jgi:hypothetical protein